MHQTSQTSKHKQTKQAKKKISQVRWLLEKVVGIRVFVGAVQVHEDQNWVLPRLACGPHVPFHQASDGDRLLDHAVVRRAILNLQVGALGVGAVVRVRRHLGCTWAQHSPRPGSGGRLRPRPRFLKTAATPEIPLIHKVTCSF